MTAQSTNWLVLWKPLQEQTAKRDLNVIRNWSNCETEKMILRQFVAGIMALRGVCIFILPGGAT